MPSSRNRFASILAFIGGGLLTLGGGVGMAPLLREIQTVVTEHISSNPTVGTVFKILIWLAALGGITVIIGGLMFWLEFKWPGKILVYLGAGIGIVGLLIGMIVAYRSGNMNEYFDGIMSTMAGIGVLLAIASTFVAK